MTNYLHVLWDTFRPVQKMSLDMPERHPGVDESIRNDPTVRKNMTEYHDEHPDCEHPNCKITRKDGTQVHHAKRPLWMMILKTLAEQIASAADKTQYATLCEPHHLIWHNGDFARRVITNMRELCETMTIVVRQS